MINITLNMDNNTLALCMFFLFLIAMAGLFIFSFKYLKCESSEYGKK